MERFSGYSYASKFRSGQGGALPEKIFGGTDLNISLTKTAKILTLINYLVLFFYVSLSCSRNEAKALNKQVMYLFIVIFFLVVWFPISLYAMILNSESDKDTVKETMFKISMAVSLWLVLIVLCCTLII